MRRSLASPLYAMHLEGWPGPADVGLVAEQGELVGAAWYRTYTEATHGYGSLPRTFPELSIAVVASRRHRGIGRALLTNLVEVSVQHGRGADPRSHELNLAAL